MPWITLNLKIVYQEPGKYQFRGTKAECQAYIKDATTSYSAEEKRANEIAFLMTKNGESTLESYFGQRWEETLEQKRRRRALRRKGLI